MGLLSFSEPYLFTALDVNSMDTASWASMKVDCVVTNSALTGVDVSGVSHIVPGGTELEWSWPFCAYTGYVKIDGSYRHEHVMVSVPESAIARRFTRDAVMFFDVSFVSIPPDPLCAIRRDES